MRKKYFKKCKKKLFKILPVKGIEKYLSYDFWNASTLITELNVRRDIKKKGSN